MSNGPYGQLACGCGVVSLLICGAPLGVGRDAEGEPVTFWPLSAIQLGQGADELQISPVVSGGDAWHCRRCDERLLHADEEAEVAVLAGLPEDTDGSGVGLTTSQQRRLEALGYRVLAGASQE
ncbi:MAG: hypothetical protein IBX53_12405 [Halomonas sp.]|uniref:hypothetical protein n=1 Tax=Halomonas sp. TaxID=1486246 RepID=UPI001A09B4EE|nr:hypothetical protein [Halomonas sp.]MBE0489869.1 hypothetical protein [Halomonas sp.]